MDLETGTRRCFSCGFEMAEEDAHCPNCLCSLHEETQEEWECGGILQPISLWVKDDGSWEILQKCSLCGELAATPQAPRDNPLKLLQLAARPLADPPFPLERIGEMTRLMGGSGSTEGYYDEP